MMHTQQTTAWARGLVAVVATWLAVAALTGAASVSVDAQAERKIWDGVYSAAQASRGKPAYETSCGRCHNNELAGSERAPALKGDGFLAHWDNDSLEVSTYKPASLARHVVEARGLLYRSEAESVINLTSLQSLNQTCP